MAGRGGDRSDAPAELTQDSFAGLSRRSLVTDAVEATAVSGATVVGASALCVLVAGYLLGVASLAAVGFLAGASLAVASTLCNRRGPLSAAAGSLAVAIGVLAVAYALSRPISESAIPLHVGSLVFAFAALVAGLGATATVPGSLGSGQWLRTVFRANTTAFLPGLLVAWAVVTNVQETGQLLDMASEGVGEGFDAVVFPVGTNANVGGFLALASFAALAVAVALGTLPVVSLLAKERRETVSPYVERTRWWLYRLASVGLPLSILLTIVPASMLHPPLVEHGLEEPLRAVVDAHVLRAMLAGVGILCLLATAATVFVRRVARLDGRRLLRVVATTTPGGLVLVGIATLRPELVLSRLRVGPITDVVDGTVETFGAASVALAVLVFLVLSTALFLTFVTTAAAVGFIPNRTAAPSVAAGGILLVAVAVGVWPGEHALLTFAAVAVSMIVWDVGNYGVDVTAELAGTTSRAVEVLHAAGSFLVGGVLVAVALGALWASETLAAGGGLQGPGLVGLVLFVLATLVLMSTLRG